MWENYGPYIAHKFVYDSLLKNIIGIGSWKIEFNYSKY